LTSIKSSIGRDKVAKELYPIGYAFPRFEPMDENTIEGFSDPITLYYRALIACGCSRCKGWEKH